MSRRCGVGGLGGLLSDESSSSIGLLVGRGALMAAADALACPLGRSDEVRAGAGEELLWLLGRRLCELEGERSSYGEMGGGGDSLPFMPGCRPADEAPACASAELPWPLSIRMVPRS